MSESYNPLLELLGLQGVGNSSSESPTPEKKASAESAEPTTTQMLSEILGELRRMNTKEGIDDVRSQDN